MFIDRVKIHVEAGRGGDGAISFRREKFVAKGGPDGGDGGRGGSIILEVDTGLGTLMDLRYRHKIKAQGGGNGSGTKSSGRSGEDVIIRVPAGTLVYNDETDELICDLTEDYPKHVVASGGRGGKGNIHFASATVQAPRKATEGRQGQKFDLRLDLKLIADVGLVGLPNAGKSTLLSTVSGARPEIANYPFTTLTPHLGIVKGVSWRGFVMADIPGLIEGASDGKGLGHQFLRHIERTKVLAILIESTDPKPDETLETLLGELESFNPSLLKRPRIIVRTKNDMEAEPWGKEEISISSMTNDGVDDLIRKLTIMIESTLENKNEEKNYFDNWDKGYKE